MPLLRSLALGCILLALAACQAGAATPRPSSTPIALGNLNATQAPTVEPSLTPAHTPTSTPDYSEATLSLLLFCAQDGPLAGANAARAAAVEAAVATLNAAGGIFGAQVALAVAEASDPEAATAALAQHADAPLAIICDAATEGALAETLAAHDLPAIAPGAFAEPGGALYGLEPAPAAALGHFAADLAANWPARQPAGVSTEIRLALFTWPAELGGALPEELLEDLGVDVVVQAELTPSLDLNVYDLVYQARERGANVFYVNADSYGLAYMLNALSNLGLRQRVLVAAPGTAYDADFYTYLGDAAFAEGLYLVSAQLAGTGDWEQAHMQAGVDLAARAFALMLGEGGPAGLTRAAAATALGELGYPRRQRTPQELAVWQVGAAPGELVLVSELGLVP